jgi:hypothetical protein
MKTPDYGHAMPYYFILIDFIGLVMQGISAPVIRQHLIKLIKRTNNLSRFFITIVILIYFHFVLAFYVFTYKTNHIDYENIQYPTYGLYLSMFLFEFEISRA